MNDLKAIKEAYRKNFTKLMASVGTPMHSHYSDIEKELDSMQKTVMGTQKNICNMTKDCSLCTGYFLIPRGNKTQTVRKDVPKGTPGAKECQIKRTLQIRRRGI